MSQKRPLRERFLEKVQKTENCWNWIGFTNRGYGGINEGGSSGRSLYAHRAAYELFVGPIPEGLCVLHHCDNKLCVNPNHLFLGTKTENSSDMVAKGRQARGERQGLAKLTWSQVREIREQYQSGSREFGTRALGRRYGVHQSEIWDIIHNHIWRQTP